MLRRKSGSNGGYNRRVHKTHRYNRVELRRGGYRL